MEVFGIVETNSLNEEGSELYFSLDTSFSKINSLNEEGSEIYFSLDPNKNWQCVSSVS